MKKIRTKAIFKKIRSTKTWYHKEDNILIVRVESPRHRWQTLTINVSMARYNHIIWYIESYTMGYGCQLLREILDLELEHYG